MPGPFVRTWGSDASTSLFYKQRTWSTQAKPYVNPLPYRLVDCRELKVYPSGFTPFGARSYFYGWSSLLPSKRVALLNTVRARLYAKLGDNASLAVTLAERKQSIDMIMSRCVQLRRAVSAVKRGDFRKASKVLGLSETPRGVSRKKQAADNFLELHFGWVPLVKDIGTAVSNLQSPVPDRYAYAKAMLRESPRSGGYPRAPEPGYQAERNEYVMGISSGFRWVITNPDLYLANQMGFTNPFAIAWELVPFSFLVDWFIPIGDFLASMTATLGVSVRGGWTTTRSYHLRHHKMTTFEGGKRLVIEHLGWATEIERTLGAVSSLPTIQPGLSFSTSRALTSASLLIQQLKSLH